MPRFYSDVREGSSFTPDDEGFEFDSLDEAEREAATSAAEIGRDRLPKGDAREVTAELGNEHRTGLRILAITSNCGSANSPRLKPVIGPVA